MILDNIKSLLRTSQISFIEEDGSMPFLRVPEVEKSGFEVSMLISGSFTNHDGNEYQLACDQALKIIDDDPAEALNDFIRALTAECRVKIQYRGKHPYRWTLEYDEAGQWQEYSSTVALVLPWWWRNYHEEYLQNHYQLKFN